MLFFSLRDRDYFPAYSSSVGPQSLSRFVILKRTRRSGAGACGRGRDGPEAGGRALRAGTAGNVFVSHANECSPKSTCCPGGPQPPRGSSDQSRGPQPVSAPSPSRSHAAGSRAGAVAAGTGATHGLVHRSQSAGRHRPWLLLSAGVRQGPLAPRKSQRFVFSGRQRSLDVKLPFLAAVRLPLWGKKKSK